MTKKSNASAVYAGTFDPITNGHIDIIERAAALFESITVAVVCYPSKSTLFSYKERLAMVEDAVSECHLENVTVEGFQGLLVDYVGKKGSKIIIRGLRAVSDYEYEAQMALINRKISRKVETVFLMTSEDRSSISASVVRDIARHGGDVSKFVPKMAEKTLLAAYSDDPACLKV